jgi:anti-anti-sigma factor
MPAANVQLSTAVTAPGERTVWLAGEIDVAVVDRVEPVLEWAVRGSGATRVVIDLSCLAFIDARGSRALGTACRCGREAGVPVRITGAAGMVRTVLALLHIIDIGQNLPAAPVRSPVDDRDR